MTDDFAVRAVALDFIGETYEMGYPFRILFADDLMKRIAARLPNGFKAANALAVNRFAITRDFSRPKIAGYVAFCAA